MARRMTGWAWWAIGLVAAVAGAAAAQSGTVTLPEGGGRQEVLELCGGCHDAATTIAKQRRTPKDWGTVVENMRAQGAQGTDDDARVILAYLTRHFGRVNVNKASAADLQGVLGFSADQARALVAYREAHGDFKTLDDLKKVEGLDPQTIEREKVSIEFTDA